jgi:glycerophosphoryl diester phosphodiesterase
VVFVFRNFLQANTIYYLSNDNLLSIIIQKPFVAFAILLFFLFVVGIFYFQFNYLIIATYCIELKKRIGILTLVKLTLRQFKKIRLGYTSFILFYFFLLLPIIGQSSRMDIISNIKIPAFILDFIFTNRVQFVVSFVLFYILCLYLALRLIYTLPLVTLKDMRLREAVKKSFEVTKKNFFRLTLTFLGVLLVLFLFFAISIFFLILLQMHIELNVPNISLLSGSLIMTVVQFITLINIVLSTIAYFFVLVRHLDKIGELPPFPETIKIKNVPSRKGRIIKRAILVLSAGILTAIVVQYNQGFLKENDMPIPETFSHRGVTRGVGVQNTIPALENVHRYAPDYVEMDIQYTKDKQFVLMHDGNLKNLCGVNKTVHQLTLKEMTALTASEHHQSAPVPSFDAYLQKANALHQKLLIELKIYVPYDEKMVDDFVEKYHDNIIKNGHHIHSLSYPIIERIKEIAPDLNCSFILPFNIIGPPISHTNAFTMEYSTLNSGFVKSAHHDGKKVLAWTVNDMDSIERMRSFDVDGIITDDMQTLNQEIKEAPLKMKYSEKILIYSTGRDVAE